MLKLLARTTAPVSRDLQENDIDVYVRLDSPATIVKKVTLKTIEINFFFNFNIIVNFPQRVRDLESVVLMTLWEEKRMGAQFQFSRSFSQLGVLCLV